jgi:hypothetical protein
MWLFTRIIIHTTVHNNMYIIIIIIHYSFSQTTTMFWSVSASKMHFQQLPGQIEQKVF